MNVFSISLVLLGLGPWAAHLSWAGGGLEEAQAKLSNSYNEYYQAVKTGKAQTKEAQLKLQKELVGPAQAEVTKVIAESEQAAILKNVGKVRTKAEIAKLRESEEDLPADQMPEAKKMAEEELKEYQTAARSPAGSSSMEPTGFFGKALKLLGGSSEKEEVVIDTKGIQSEIIFQKSQDKPAPKK